MKVIISPASVMRRDIDDVLCAFLQIGKISMVKFSEGIGRWRYAEIRREYKLNKKGVTAMARLWRTTRKFIDKERPRIEFNLIPV